MALWILSGTTRVSQYQKGKTKTNLDLLEQETVGVQTRSPEQLSANARVVTVLGFTSFLFHSPLFSDAVLRV